MVSNGSDDTDLAVIYTGLKNFLMRYSDQEQGNTNVKEQINTNVKEQITTIFENVSIVEHWGSNGTPLEKKSLSNLFTLPEVPTDPNDTKQIQKFQKDMNGIIKSIDNIFKSKPPVLELNYKINNYKSALYPNNEAPSDHPPCCAEIKLI